MRPSVNDLKLTDEKFPETALDELPDFGGFAPPPQPGPYRFKTPADLSHCWEPFTTEKGERVALIFDRDFPLTIIASPGNASNGETFTTRLNNLKRKRGSNGIEASDLDYLLKAWGGKKAPSSNREYIVQVNKHAGAEFGGDLTYSFSCNPKRPIRMQNEEGQSVEVPDKMGCGKRYYMKDLQRGSDGLYPTEITCECGAHLRTFGSIENFRT